MVVATLTLGLRLNVKYKGPLKPKTCLGVKHTLENGECRGWNPMTPKCIPTLGIMNVQNLGWKGKKTPNWAPNILVERFWSVDA
jgi:hypothetical protein